MRIAYFLPAKVGHFHRRSFALSGGVHRILHARTKNTMDSLLPAIFPDTFIPLSGSHSSI